MNPLWHHRELTDAAILLLNAARRDQLDSLGIKKPRIATALFGTVDPVQIRLQAAVLRFVSTTEAYVDALNSELLVEGVGTSSGMLRALVDQAEQLSSGSWPERKRAFSRLHDVRLGQQAAWPQVSAAAKARNSIAHGLGSLTTRQRNDPSLPTTLLSVHIHISDGRLVLTDASAAAVHDACMQFIKSIDAAVTKA